MYELQDWAAVQRIYRDTKSIRKTAKILDMARNTVRRLLKMKTMPTYNQTIYTSCLDPYKERIIAWRCKPYEFNGTRIFKELKKLGYARSIGPVYRFLQRIDEDVGRISTRATVRIETPLGDQAQFDWSEYLVVLGCHEKKLNFPPWAVSALQITEFPTWKSYAICSSRGQSVVMLLRKVLTGILRQKM